MRDHLIPIEQIRAARERAGGIVKATPVDLSATFSALCQRQIYLKLYPMLAEQANGSLGSVGRDVASAATSAANTVERAGGDAARAVEGVGSRAVSAVEGAGTQAVEGLRSAAVDFFQHMKLW